MIDALNTIKNTSERRKIKRNPMFLVVEERV